jgi:hypothetical protein
MLLFHQAIQDNVSVGIHSSILANTGTEAPGSEVTCLRSHGSCGRGSTRTQVYGPDNVILPLQRGIMGFWKFSTFLALSILVLCQVGSLQAAHFR